MRGLRQADVVGALAVVAEAGAVATPAEFPRQVLPHLRTLLRADIASFTGAPSGGGPPTWLFEPAAALSNDLAEAMAEYAAEHPLVSHFARTGDARAVRVSDFVGLREFQRLGIYDGCFRPLGAKYQLAASIALEGPVPSGLGFTRSRSDFTERERTLLDLVRPHLASAYRRVADRAEYARRLATLERGLEAAGRAVVGVKDGRLEPLSPQAAALLQRWFGTAAPPAPGGTVVLERGDATLRVRAVDGDPSLILLDETSFGLDPERARSLGLTGRETEVLALVARGLTDAEAARQLYVSVRTIGKHLQHAYRKLGAGTRDEAVAAVLAR